MKNRLWTTLVFSSFLTLTACQILSVLSSEPNTIPKTSEIKNNEAPTTLILPIPDSDGDGILDDIDNCPKTPVNIVVDNDGCPVSVNLMGPLAVEIRTYFEQGSAKFSREGYATDIDKIAEKFSDYTEYDYLPFVILGHISKPEALAIQTAKTVQVNNTRPINQQLARNRAQLVKDRLVSGGISASRIYTYDCGTNYQIVSNDADETALMNQRVFGWSAVEDEKYIVQPYGLQGYKEKCKAF